MCCCGFVFFKQKTAYEMRSSDWSSDVCSSDLFTTTRDWDAAVAWAEPRLADLGDPYSFSKEAVIVWGMRESARIVENRGIRLNLLRDRKSVVEGTRVSVRVDLGGRRIIKKKINRHHTV